MGAWLPYSSQCRATMLFSHGNAVDLGLMLPFYRLVTEASHIQSRYALYVCLSFTGQSSLPQLQWYEIQVSWQVTIPIF